MCSIAGVFSRKNENVYPLLVDMVLMMSHRGSDGFGIAINEKVIKSKNKADLQNDFVEGSFGIAHSLLSITGHGLQPFSSCNKKFFLCHNGQIYNYLELNKKLSGHKFESDSDSETIVHFLEQTNFDLKKFMATARGSYSVAFSKNNQLFAFRDLVGVKPLWFGENDRFFAFASEPIALRKLNIEFPRPLLPGHCLVVSKGGFKVEKIFTLKELKKQVKQNVSFDRLFASFVESISVRSNNLSRAGVLFSGGIDSSVVASAVSKNVKDVGLFSCGMEGSEDLVFADKVASSLGLRLFDRVVQKDEVPLLALNALKAMGFFDTMQLGIALPLYCSVELAKKKNFKVVFSGQGSDEIFAGYSYFKRFLLEGGFAGVNQEIWAHLEGIWSRNLFRDDIVSMSHSVELRLPFLDHFFLKDAMGFPVDKKILSHDDNLRKHPVRKMGEKLGVPLLAVNRPKKAMQYGSGFAKELERIFG